MEFEVDVEMNETGQKRTIAGYEALGGYTAIQHDAATIDRAGIMLSVQASFVPGTFRSLRPAVTASAPAP